ncbi:MAG: PAS domain S-box protein [Acidobacteria bacterium]|nr:PAS domain S-box protein [Acidobacteriota bacterium]
MAALEHESEDELLRSVALQNVTSIHLARQRAEEELFRTKEALRESRERLRAALSAAGTGTFRWDIPTNIVEWDGNIDRMFGLDPTKREQSLEVFARAIHPDDRPAFEENLRRCVHDGSDFDMEFRVVRPDGTVCWVHDRAKGFRDAEGRVLYMTGACADVTSRKVAAEAQRATDDRLRAMFNQAAVGMAIVALDGTFLDTNRKFADILGYSGAELRSRTFRELTHPEHLRPTQVATEDLLSGKTKDFSLEKQYIRKDGAVVWSRTTVTLLRDGEGRPQRFLSVIEDITSRKRAELALLDESRTLELLNESGKLVAAKLDLQSLVQAVTDAATQLSGAQFGSFFYTTSDENGDALVLYTLSGAPREAFEKFGQPRATALFGPTFRGEAPIRVGDVRKDPRYGTMPPHRGMPKGHLPVRSYLAVPVRSRSGEVIGGLFFGHAEPDVFTERAERLVVGIAAQAGIAIDNARLYEAAQRSAEERKVLLESERAARTAAERMSSIKDEFLATLSHELRTPLNAILGWSQVLRSGIKNPADLTKGLETIERNARVQTQLIEDLLDMSRITSGKLRLDVQTTMPSSFIEAAIETVKPSADAKGLRIEQLLDPSAGPISGDPGRMQQVVWNLLSNAIKFTPRGGKVQILLERVNSHVEITVTDTGIGIKPELIPHLFERFRQGDASTTRHYGGLGLGLSIVQSLVELHGGTVAIKSPGDGSGTTVSVHLPVSAVHRGPHAEPRLHPGVSQQGLGTHVASVELQGLKVLVVDDQADARELIQRVLGDCGAIVYVAASADEAVRLVIEHKPDVLVSDIGMPDADGFELLRRIRALDADQGGRVPAIALTAFARSEDRTRALRAGFVVHVAKPVDPSELIATVASVAGRVSDRS